MPYEIQEVPGAGIMLVQKVMGPELDDDGTVIGEHTYNVVARPGDVFLDHELPVHTKDAIASGDERHLARFRYFEDEAAVAPPVSPAPAAAVEPPKEGPVAPKRQARRAPAKRKAPARRQVKAAVKPAEETVVESVSEHAAETEANNEQAGE
jgi:hypothetical protein